jgi:hypothetical protein
MDRHASFVSWLEKNEDNLNVQLRYGKLHRQEVAIADTTGFPKTELVRKISTFSNG